MNLLQQAELERQLQRRDARILELEEAIKAVQVEPVLGLDEIMKLADAYADASFEQGLNQVVDTQIPEQRRDALYTAIDAMLTSNTAPQEPAVNAELLEALDTIICVVGLTAFKHEAQRAVLQEAVDSARAVISKATGSAA